MSSVSELKKLHEAGQFTIGGRVYEMSKMPWKEAKKIFAYLTVVAGELELGQMGFIDTPKFEVEIEPKLLSYMMVDGFKLSTIPDYFDDYPCDYVQFVTMSIQGFAAPFLPETATSSPSQAEEDQIVTLKKPM